MADRVRKSKSLHHITIECSHLDTRLEYNITTDHISIHTGKKHVNKESRSKWGKQHYTKNKELYLERARRQRIDNMDTIAVAQKQYRIDNRESIAAYQKIYKKEHPTDPRKYLTAAGSCTTLNPWFDGCRRHHVDLNTIVHIPADIHTHNRHNIRTGKGMDVINALAFKFLFQGSTL